MHLSTRSILLATSLFTVAAALPAQAETPKRGGTLTYMIPAASPPSFDGHKETTYATVHSAAPFYSTLVQVNPEHPDSTTDFVCDLCTSMPTPTDGGKTWSFTIRDGVTFHDGTALTAADVAESWKYIIDPPDGVSSARSANYAMIESVAAPDAKTVVFKLKYATTAFLPGLADPFNWIYSKAQLTKDPHFYEKNIMGSGPFKFTDYQIGQSISGVRNENYYHKGLPYLDGFTGIYAPKQAIRLDAIRADRAAMEFRGLPPSARDQLEREMGKKVNVQSSDWNCVNIVTPNHKAKPFDDVRVRKALALSIDAWHGAPALSKIAVIKTVGGIVFPGSPMAATKAELESMAGFWPDAERARAEAKRLLKEAGVPNLSFELLNRNVDQPYKYVAIWLIDEWRKAGITVKQRVLPTGPLWEALRSNNFEVALEFNCKSVVNPVLDVAKFLPMDIYTENYGNYLDPKSTEIYNRMLVETNAPKQRTMMREFEKHVLDDQVHHIMTPWWYRIVPAQSYVKGWGISPSHYLNQNLATVWLDR